MINIRYHIVSITAVFLALGIGVVLGSTFLDRATLSVLDRNIRSAEQRIRETRAENDRLRDQVDEADERDESMILVGGEHLLPGHLDEVPVVVVTAPGTDQADLDALRTSLERAGADLTATLALTDGLRFEDGVDDELATTLELDDPSAAELSDAVLGQLAEALAVAGTPIDETGAPPGGEDPTTTSTTTTTVPTAPTTTVPGEEGTTTTVPAGDDDEPIGPEGEPPLLRTLIDRELVTVVPGPGRDVDDPLLDRPGHRYVFAGPSGLTDAQHQLLIDLLSVPAAERPLPGIVVTTTTPVEPGQDDVAPTVVARVRTSTDLNARYGTVDDLETFVGLTATVVSLEQLPLATPGHYGQAEGAEALLPPPR